MEIRVIDVTSAGMSMVQTCHRNEILSWDVSAYSRTSDRANAEDITRTFDEINAYWAQSPAAHQDAVWVMYKKMHDVIQYNSDITSLKRNLQELVRDLYELIDLSAIKHWLLFRSDVRFPSNIKTQYEDGESQESTYLRDDYYDLITLAIALRPMVPIFGEYIGAARKEAGSHYKEYEAMKLLYLSNLNESDPMQRLKVYIDDRVESMMREDSNLTVVLNGMGTSEIPDWVRGMTIVRKLAIHSVTSTDDKAGMISVLYKFVVNAVKSMRRKMSSRFGGKVSEKSNNAQSGDESNNSSLVENYKVKQEVADGDLIVLAVYTEQYEQMARTVEPDVPDEYLRQCIQSVVALENQQIYQGAITLVQWIMAPCISPRGVPLLSKPALMRTLAATQAILWHWEFYDLAALVTAVPQANSNEKMFNALESRSRVPKDLTDELVQAFPHNRIGRSKQQTVRQTNEAYKSIDALCEIITKSDWILTAPEQLVELTSRIPATRRMFIPGDIRIQLAKLVLKFTKDRSQYS